MNFHIHHIHKPASADQYSTLQIVYACQCLRTGGTDCLHGIPTLCQYFFYALAVCLAAGIDGIRNKIEPPEEVPENVYELKEEEKASRGIESLPADLHAAICELQKDAFIKEVLGEHISSKLIEAKEAEWMQYRTQVTGWEIEEYLYKI